MHNGIGSTPGAAATRVRLGTILRRVEGLEGDTDGFGVGEMTVGSWGRSQVQVGEAGHPPGPGKRLVRLSEAR
jgi:hypothetical protein